MAVTLTVAKLAARMRISADPAVAPSEPILGILTGILATAKGEVEGYAPAAPEEPQNEATIRMAGWLYESSPLTQGNPFIHSGARALLSRYHTSAPVNTGILPSPVGVTETIIVPSHPVNPGNHKRYIGWSDDVAVTQAELDVAVSFNSDVLTVPTRVANGYLWFSVPDSEGYPDSLIRQGNPTNQISFFAEQAGMLTAEGDDYLVGLNPNLLNPASLSGQTITLGYSG